MLKQGRRSSAESNATSRHRKSQSSLLLPDTIKAAAAPDGGRPFSRVFAASRMRFSNRAGFFPEMISRRKLSSFSATTRRRPDQSRQRHARERYQFERCHPHVRQLNHASGRQLVRDGVGLGRFGHTRCRLGGLGASQRDRRRPGHLGHIYTHKPTGRSAVISAHGERIRPLGLQIAHRGSFGRVDRLQSFRRRRPGTRPDRQSFGHAPPIR